jgi:2-C-methyl-D-erythritol 4-phosphate cytidylyltransferase/2-C-methyl-D-erythritol 2,4-cyclodiphosphate synthase
MQVSAIIAAGGSGSRVAAGAPKQFLRLADGRTILERSVAAFAYHERVDEIVVALPPDSTFAFADNAASGRLRTVSGGVRRQDSVANAFDAIAAASDIVLVHDAARPFVSADVISRAIDAAAEHGAAIVALPAVDTVKQVTMEGGRRVIAGTIPRESVYLAQTPQAFRRDVLAAAVAIGRGGAHATDEAALAELAGYPVHIVEGDPGNVKITTADDLERARRREMPVAVTRVGTGYDLHRLVEGRALIIGGVEIASDRGALGHSDADVACHAVTDAILGGASLGAIGRHFPDTDARWKGASSVELLRQAQALVRASGYTVANVDVTIVLERPKVAPYIAGIREGLASALGIPADCVSVKGKTNEGVDAVGRGEAIAAHAVALLVGSVLERTLQ